MEQHYIVVVRGTDNVFFVSTYASEIDFIVDAEPIEEREVSNLEGIEADCWTF